MKRKNKKQIDRYQCSFDQEVFIDLFSGGGGTSMGIEEGTGFPVFAAVNHDPDAIRMHMTNHPYTKHYQTSVWDVDPVTVCEGRPVGLLWASPDCKHFSKARGGKPVNKNIRSLSWVVLKWALDVRPRVLMMEKGVRRMTPQEAIRRIQQHNEIHRKKEFFAVHITKALQMAVEALEKQVPQKLVLEGDGYVDGCPVYDIAICPICGHKFEEDINDWGSKYCPDCGQALDWEGTNEAQEMY